MPFADVRCSTKESIGGVLMKRLLTFILVMSLLVITGTLVAADGQTRSIKQTGSHVTFERTMEAN
jgi:hypothetical protein